MSIACLFPGQGSQSVGMGAGLFDRFADWTAEADAILGYSIRQLCLEDARAELVLTQFTQPALYVVNAMTWRARTEDGPPAPVWLAGHSLGEYNALQAAGVFDFATGLRLVQRRGALMGQVTGGGMAAVIGLAPDRIEAVLAASDAGRRVDVANFNSADQTVIAGPEADLAAVQPAFEAAGAKKYSVLKVSAPFHSRYMRGPMEEFASFLAGFTFNPPAIPVIANVTATPYPAEAVRETLARQIGHSVRWLETMHYLFENGVSEVEEIGPGNVLTKLAQRIKKARPA
jgi:malonyl CoA-acyl carrier protein transacylase